MPSKRTHSGRSNLPFDLDEIMRLHTSEDQARIQSSMQQLDAGVQLETVMAGLEPRLVGAVAAAIIENAVVSNLSANDMLGRMGMSHMTESKTHEFGYSGDSRASGGRLPPASANNSLSRYLRSILHKSLPQSVVDRADAHTPAEQTLIRRGIRRLRTGTPPSVLASEPGSEIISSLISLLITDALERGETVEGTLRRMGVAPQSLTELARVSSQRSS